MADWDLTGGLDAAFPAALWLAPHLRVVVDEILVPEPILLPEPILRIFLPVLLDPGAYLMPTEPPVEEVPLHWKVYTGMDYFCLQDELLEAWNAVEEAGDAVEEAQPTDHSKPSSHAAVEAFACASQTVTKGDASINGDRLLLEEINPSSPLLASIGLPATSAMPNDAPAAFVPMLQSSRVSNNRGDSEHRVE